MQGPGPRGGGFLGKRKRQHGYYNYPPASSTWSSEQAVRFAPPPPPPPFFAKPPPPPPPFFAKPAPRVREPYRPAVTRFGAGAKPPPPPPPPPPADAAKCSAGTNLMAGYLAHEYLTYGTLLGEPVLPPPPPIQKEKEPAAPAPSTPPKPSERYAEVSRLIMGGGARIPGIVNPSQLGGWLGIKK